MASRCNDAGDAGDSSSNIQVFVRIRPPGNEEAVYSRVVDVDPSGSQVILRQNPTPRIFRFDHVADIETTQEAIFNSLGKKVIENCIAGYNGTIFAYGQTGSGKTFTMLGPTEEADNFQQELRGVIPRSFEYLYSLIRREKELHGDNKQFLCKCSFLEIYNEQIFDLLEPSSTQLHIRESFKTGMYVAGLAEQAVSDAAEAFEVLNSSWINRRVAATAMNRESSRSHAVFTLAIESKERKGAVEHIRTSQLNLVDLAGSERQKDTQSTGIRLKEAGSINKSLSNLGNVIMALVSASRDGKKRFIPYRDSKLTLLLRDSLGGNSKTSLIACVHSGHKSFGETLSTLQFAKRAKLIKNKAILNENALGNIKQLQEEIKSLKDELRQFKAQGIPTQLSAGPVEAMPVLKEMFLQAMQLQQKTEADKIDVEGRYQELRERTDKMMRTNKMVIKFRENRISLLEQKLKGAEVPDTRVEDLQKEVNVLMSQVEHHPLVVQYAGEVQQLKSTIRVLRGDAGSLAHVTSDRQRMEQLEARYKELIAEQEQNTAAGMVSPDRSNPVSTATLEKLKSQIFDLETEVAKLKETLADTRQAAEKKEVVLSSELDSCRSNIRELEAVMAATATRNKLEKAALNEMHLQTVKTITTPKKECYKLRSRTVVSTSSFTPDLNLDGSLTFDADDHRTDGEVAAKPDEADRIQDEIEDTVMLGEEQEPSEMVEQAQAALIEQIQQLQDQISEMETRLTEYDTDRVKHVQQQTMLESQLTRTQELYEQEQKKTKNLEGELSVAVLERDVNGGEVTDLRMVLASADRELKEYKEKLRSTESSKTQSIEVLETKMLEVEMILKQLTKENEKLLEERDGLEVSLEIEAETRLFQEGLVSTLEETMATNTDKIKELEHNLQMAEMTIIEEKEAKESLVNQLNSEGLEKDKEALMKMEENKSLQDENQSLRNLLEAHEDSAVTLRRVISEKDNKVMTLEKTIKQTEDELTRQYERVHSDSDTITELKEMLSSCEEQLTFYRRLEDESNSAVAKLRSELVEKEEQLGATNQQREAEMEMVNEDMRCVQSNLDEMRGECENLQEQLAQSQSEKSGLRVEIAGLNEEIGKLKDRLMMKEQVTAELSNKETELSSLTQQLEELQASRILRNTEISQLKDKLHDKEQCCDELTQQVGRLQTECQESRITLEKQGETMLRLESKLTSAQAEMFKAIAKAGNVNAEKEVLHRKLTEVFLDKEELQRENDDLQETSVRLTDLAEKDSQEKLQLQTELQSLQTGLNLIKQLYSDMFPLETTSTEDLVQMSRTIKEEHHRLQEANSDLARLFFRRKNVEMSRTIKEEHHRLQEANCDLVSHQNHKQKIKYHEQMKQENSQLKKDLAHLEVKYKQIKEQQRLGKDSSTRCDTALKENVVPS